MRIPYSAALLVPRLPNRWDLLAMPLVFGVLFALAWSARQMAVPYQFGTPLPLSLDLVALPYYALRTTLRMVLALGLSLAFTLAYGNLAAKSRRAEQIMIPVLDVLQSVPILGFLSITVLWFVQLFPGRLLGPELAAIFAIFTSQAWNMTFSFYYSQKLLPSELRQVADLFRLGPWRRFWRLEVPHAVPGLVWNTMMSVSGGWFFVVAAEAITVADRTVLLPGVGSYIALAIQKRNLAAIGWAVLTMLVVIVLYDQLAFRPLVAWADKFRLELSRAEEAPTSWFLNVLCRTRWLHALARLPARSGTWLTLRLARWHGAPHWQPSLPELARPRLPSGHWLERLWTPLLALAAAASIVALAHFVLEEAPLAEVGAVFLYGFCTLLRVAVLTLLAALIWVPVGVWIGLRPRLAARVQPVTLFLSAFPANLLFPLAVIGIDRAHLNPEIWTSPLMILGTQWYILFNVIGGAAALPNDLREVAVSLGLRGWALWQRVLLPAVFPAFLTGGLTASGGAWNASVVAEVVSWGDTTLRATGIGAYIAQHTAHGDQARVVLGIAVMSLYVVLINRLFWKRLYDYAQRRLALD
ncbi:MAG TPA: ABC transporter permease subunit [Candidatus Competibacteraceae bacterium]|nr:ABC transporter permease subunit [Candidatus Competibacteraceae bacterium]